ncbi:MAG: FtsL-like putative cell division protein [Bacteroidales bacterium]
MCRKKIKKDKEFISPGLEMKETARFRARDLFGGSVFSKEIVIRQIPFVVFLAVLILTYIGNQYRGDKVIREVLALEKRVKELKAESSSVTFDLQVISTESRVKELIRLSELPLIEAKTPPYQLTID